jgi:hypothetical protein
MVAGIGRNHWLEWSGLHTLFLDVFNGAQRLNDWNDWNWLLHMPDVARQKVAVVVRRTQTR